MSLGAVVVAAVRVEGRSKGEVAREYKVSRRWVHELVKRYDAHGEAGLEPRSRRPVNSRHQTSPGVENKIVALLKQLDEQGHDAGAHTIAFHLTQQIRRVPSVATIRRILRRRGFVTPQPQKRPRSSFIRFAADPPNERWQADITHWRLAGGTDVEILNMLDDHSRFLVGSWPAWSSRPPTPRPAARSSASTRR
jgi:transposase